MPAAGLATRLNGLPKFLLPIDSSGTTLLDYHVALLLDAVDRITIPVRPENARFIAGHAQNDRVTIVAMETESMADTVRRCFSDPSRDFDIILGMPDTYFSKGNPYFKITGSEFPSGAFVMGVWPCDRKQRGKFGQVNLSSDGHVREVVDKDPSCQFAHMWGVLRFPVSSISSSLRNCETIGDLFATRAASDASILSQRNDGEYVDCGTFEGVRTLYEVAGQDIIRTPTKSNLQ